MTDWDKTLNRRATAVDRAKQALDEDIAAARLDGHSFREIGRWASVNHERARTIATRINGDSRTRAERGEAQTPLGEERRVPAVEALEDVRAKVAELPPASEEPTG